MSTRTTSFWLAVCLSVFMLSEKVMLAQEAMFGSYRSGGHSFDQSQPTPITPQQTRNFSNTNATSNSNLSEVLANTELSAEQRSRMRLSPLVPENKVTHQRSNPVIRPAGFQAPPQRVAPQIVPAVPPMQNYPMQVPPTRNLPSPPPAMPQGYSISPQDQLPPPVVSEYAPEETCGAEPCEECVEVCEPCRPVWAAGIDLLLLRRSDPQSNVPILDINGSAQTLSPSQLDFDMRTGPRVRISRLGANQRFGQEVEWLSVTDFSETRRFAGNNIVTLGQGVGNGSALARYDSDLQSLEYKFRYYVSPWTSFITGARWIQLNEFASVTATGGAGTFTQIDEATNNLFGWQGGIEHALYDKGGSLTLDSIINFGVYANSSDDRRSIRNTIAAINIVNERTSTDLAFALDLGLRLNYQMFENLKLTAGYQLLYVNNVALAGDQLLNVTPPSADESVLFHGSSFGCELFW